MGHGAPALKVEADVCLGLASGRAPWALLCLLLIPPGLTPGAPLTLLSGELPEAWPRPQQGVLKKKQAGELYFSYCSSNKFSFIANKEDLLEAGSVIQGKWPLEPNGSGMEFGLCDFFLKELL